MTLLWLPKAAVPSARVADPDSSAKYCGKSLACNLPNVCRERFLQEEQVPQTELLKPAREPLHKGELQAFAARLQNKGKISTVTRFQPTQ